MRNTSHSQPCAAVPDSEPLCAERPSELSAETLPLNHGRNSEMSTTSDATPAILSLTVHRRASKLYPEEAVASPADPLAGVQAGPADPLAGSRAGHPLPAWDFWYIRYLRPPAYRNAGIPRSLRPRRNRIVCTSFFPPSQLWPEPRSARPKPYAG